MTDAERVASKLALIETRLRELRTLAKPALIAEDVFQERFVEYTLQTAVQAALDVASHIVSEERLGEPATTRLGDLDDFVAAIRAYVSRA